jgi:hypothetical protein
MRGVFAPSHAETSAFGSRASPSDRSKRSSSERRWEWRTRRVPERPALTGGRVRRAARIAAQKMRARASRFFLRKRPFLPARHGERGGKVTRTAGESTFGHRRAVVFRPRRGFSPYARSVILEPNRDRNRTRLGFGRFRSPPRGWKKFGAWQSPEFSANETRDSSFSGLNRRHVGADEKLALIF